MKGKHRLVVPPNKHTHGSHGARGAYEIANYSLGYNFYMQQAVKWTFLRVANALLKIDSDFRVCCVCTCSWCRSVKSLTCFRITSES